MKQLYLTLIMLLFIRIIEAGNPIAPPNTAGITNNTGTTILTCSVASISLTATGGVSYVWSGGLGNAANASVVNPGTYTVTATASNGATSTASIAITRNTKAPKAKIINMTGSTVLTCTTTSIHLNAAGGVSYLWNDELGVSPMQTISSPGIYTVTVTGWNGCTATASIAITQNTTHPAVVIANNSGTNLISCTTPAIQVTASGGVSYSWSGGLGGQPNATITSAGAYKVTVTGANGCTAKSSITIGSNTMHPTATIANNSGSTELTCTLIPINLTAGGGADYNWSGGLGAATNASIYGPGTYTVTVTGSNGCTATSSIAITSNTTLPNVGITNNSGTTALSCSTSSISVTATGGVNYAWSGGLGNLPNASINSAGTYTVTATSSNGCSDIATVAITNNTAPPNAVISNNSGTTVLSCATTSINVTATGGATYAWSGGLGQNPNALITSPGTYTVTVTGSNGCTATTSITTTLNTTPVIANIINNTGSTVLTCTGTAISVTGTGGATYSWSGGLGSLTNAWITSAGTYTVTATGSNGCTGTASIAITSSTNLPNVGITNNTGTTILTCTTTTISVTATGGSSYVWSGYGTSSNNYYTSAGTYTVTVTSGNGCTAIASITITSNTTPPIAGITNNSGTTLLTCANPSISLTATGGTAYAWSGGLGSQANATVNAPGTYTVAVSGANGCTATASMVVTANSSFVLAGIVNNTGTTVLTCTITPINLTANGGVSYSWSGGLGSSPIASISSAGIYTVTVTGTNGCTGTASIAITSNTSIPVVGITNNTVTYVLTCNTTHINVTATGGSTYVWTAPLGSAANASITSPGTYTVTVTKANGCTASASITTTINTVPPVAGITNVSGTTVLACLNTYISVMGTGGGTYVWSGGLGSSANAVIPAAGTYTVSVTGANGCSASATITITGSIIYPPVSITNNSGTNVITCTNHIISLTATGGATFAWSSGLGSDANISISTAGTYTVTATNTEGCTASASITLTNSPTIPTLNLYQVTGNCNLTSVSYAATSNGNSYAWSGGLGTTSVATMTSSGTYTVTVTDNNNCTASASVNASIVSTPPTAGIINNSGTNLLTCSTTIINVTATGGVSYNWSSGFGQSVNLTHTGTYTVTATGVNGCTSTASIVINADTTTPIANITNNTGTTVLTCSTTFISVTATGGVTYVWSGTGGSSSNNYINSAGSYTVTVTGSNGCSATKSITITNDVLSPTPVITYNPGSCNGANVSLIATGGISYEWSSPWGNSATANITTAGTYTVSVVASNGCTNIASAYVTLNTLPPTAGITNNSGTTLLSCATQNISLTATGGASYVWSGGSGATPNGNVHITSAGTYTVTVTGTNGCSATASIAITSNISSLPIAGITNNTGSTVITCSTNHINLTATGGNSYTWSSGLGANANAVISSAGTYTVTVTDGNGCSASASIVTTSNITTDYVSIVNNTGVTVLTCAQPAISLTATGGGTYLWSGSLGSNANAIITSAGTYTVTATFGNGCTRTNYITITSSTNAPVAGISNLSGTTVLNCSNTAIVLQASGGVSYAWNNTPGILGKNFIMNAGTYTVTATGSNGCSATASITITSLNSPTGLSSSQITMNSALVRWNKTNNVQYYDVLYRILGSPDYQTYSPHVYLPDTSIVLNGLSSSTTYQWLVRSVCAGGLSYIESQPATFTTLMGLQAAPDNPVQETQMTAPKSVIQEQIPLFSVSPNPSNGRFHVDAGALQNGTALIRVLDQLGKSCYTQSLRVDHTAVSTDVDLSDFPPGLYYLQLVNGNQVWTEKIVIW